MITQLNPPIPLLTPKGEGIAHMIIDYGPEYDLFWTVFLNDSGECWTFPNPQVRATKNFTMGRTNKKPANGAALQANGTRPSGVNGTSHSS